MYSILFLLFVRLPESDVYKAGLHSAVFFFLFVIMISYISLSCISNLSMCSGDMFLPLLWCHQAMYLYCLMCFFLFCEAFSISAAVLSRAALTDWLILCRSMSLFLWVSVCALSPSSLLSFRLYQTKAYFKTFWKRYISLIPFYSSLPVFCLHCLFWFSVCVTK